MRKRMFIVLLVCILIAVSVAPALAAGDKVRGEKGEGCVAQEQVEDPPPFPVEDLYDGDDNCRQGYPW